MPPFRSGKPTCHLSLSTPYTQGAGSATVVFDQGAEDPAGQWGGTGTGTIVVDRDGLYVASFGIGRASVAVTSAISAQLRVDGNLAASLVGATTTATTGLCGARSMHLEAGQVLSMTATLHTAIAADFQQRPTFLTLDRIGPVRWTG